MLLSGEEIYRNFSQGAGTGGLQAGAAIVKEIAGEYVEEAAAIRKLTARMESAWQGTAAGAANRGAAPLTTEHESSGSALVTAQFLTSFEAEVFALSKNNVVPVPPKPTAPDPWAFLGNPGELVVFEDQVDDHNAAAKHNVAVMTSYTSSTADISQQLPIEYGSLSADGAGIEVRTDPGADADDSDRATRDAMPRHDSDSAAERPRLADGPVRGTEASSTPDSGPGSTSPGSVTAQAGPTLPAGEPVGSVRPAPAAPPSTGVVGVPGLWGPGGVPEAGGARGETAGPRGGGAAPRNGFVPRNGGAPYEGALRGATPESATRPAAGVIGGGRNSPAAHGVPVGAAGRGRDEEDREHRRPTYLEGDDPDDLFGSEVLTAPPTIGAEDDD